MRPPLDPVRQIENELNEERQRSLLWASRLVALSIVFAWLAAGALGICYYLATTP